MKTIAGTVKWGIIGCGDVCEVKSGPAFSKVPDSALVAVMRRDREKARDYASRHGVARYYSDPKDLIDDREVNAIYIATPPAFHEMYTEAALKAGKPVYVEKPVALHAASCERMINLARQYDSRVSVAHYRRKLPLFCKVKDLILSKAVGDVRLIQLRTLQPPTGGLTSATKDNWRVNPALSGGGLFHDLSPHQLDILYWIFGIPEIVSAYSMNQSELYDAPDAVVIRAVFGKKILLNGIWAFSVAENAAEDRCEIVGDRGKITFSFFRKSTVELTGAKGTESFAMEYPENIQEPMIAAVTRFFRGEAPNPCSLEDALVSLRMMDMTAVNDA